jgi:hypothetical protein
MIPDLPRLHTAIAEWASCLLYIFLLRKRFALPKIVALAALALSLLIVVQFIGGAAPITLWIPWMMVALILMYVFILVCGDLTLRDAGYIWARAFIVAEFAASLEWQIYYYLALQREEGGSWLSFICMVGVYIAALSLVGFLEHKRIPKNTRLDISLKECGSSLLIALSAFLISNVNFAFKDTDFMASIGAGVLSVRTLVDFSGLIMFFAQQEQRREVRLRYELDAMNNVLRRQYDYYQQTKESIDIIRRQYHDLKHQITVIRQEEDPGKRESYLAEMDQAIGVYEAQNKTGNKVLDTVLTNKNLMCLKKKINMTCVADGQLLDFIEVMDICSIFGNAIDNAIESVETLKERDKRLIHVSVFSQNAFLMLRFENYCETPLNFQDGLPTTTKKNKTSHGFGIRSIKRTVEKYGGSLTISADHNWFVIRALIPLPEK